MEQDEKSRLREDELAGLEARPDPLYSLAIIRRAAGEIRRLRMELSREERLHMDTINARDLFEDFLGDSYAAAKGRQPEWSNLFGAEDAFNEISETFDALRARITELESLLAEAREVVKPFGDIFRLSEGPNGWPRAFKHGERIPLDDDTNMNFPRKYFRRAAALSTKLEAQQ